MATEIFPETPSDQPDDRARASAASSSATNTLRPITREGHYRGVTYVVEAIPVGDTDWRAHFRLTDLPISGDDDSLHPSLDATWATENEALSYATEAACHAIETREFGRPQGQGHGSGSTARRTDSLGQ
ncbi:hypothetical protein [Roseateles amylovorans]|uniref:Uncharacterized protein n=1 Tax=Roseateles amylovorans TaxID=2978473 RepID=A0ABY6B1C1_9BURK|nr:hypothetical protein [Roseateles amylovorans]UXH79202.1 hypothetical protein N4261_04490 [Roseateles amylovorans]